jgi:fibronectin type 3 domain-containing protein
MELEATGNDEGKIVLIWRLPETPVQKFRIYRSTASMEHDFSTPLTEVPYPNTLYVDSGLNHSETYHYVVRSVDSEGAEETNTIEISETSYELIPPTAPADVEATQMPSGAIRLGWSHALPEDVSVYRVFRGVGAGSPTAGVPIGETNLTHYEDMDTTSGQSYAYLVRAVDIHGNEETNRNVVRTMSVDILPPDPPSNLTAFAVSGGDVELEWVAVPEWNVTYNVYRSSSSDSGNLTKIASTNATLFVDTGLVNGRKYFYAVRAQDAAGNEEGNSIMASAVASKGGPRVVLAIALVAIFVMGAYAVDRRRRIAEAEGA